MYYWTRCPEVLRLSFLDSLRFVVYISGVRSSGIVLSHAAFLAFTFGVVGLVRVDTLGGSLRISVVVEALSAHVRCAVLPFQVPADKCAPYLLNGLICLFQFFCNIILLVLPNRLPLHSLVLILLPVFLLAKAATLFGAIITFLQRFLIQSIDSGFLVSYLVLLRGLVKKRYLLYHGLVQFTCVYHDLARCVDIGFCALLAYLVIR